MQHLDLMTLFHAAEQPIKYGFSQSALYADIDTSAIKCLASITCLAYQIRLILSQLSRIDKVL